MRVAICDENLVFLEDLERKLNNHYLVTQVQIYSSPLELVMRIQEEEKYELIFMDIDWGTKEKQNGLRWGEEICELLPEAAIIFITGYNDQFAQHVLLTEANTLGYMTKPIDDTILERYLEKAKNRNVEPKYLVISRKGGKISVPMDKIIYIESRNHKAVIHTEEEEYVIYEKLIDLQKRLLDNFIPCHKSYIINMEWIATYEGKSFNMRNGQNIPISRTYTGKVKDLFFRYLGEGI